ncbi:MAG: citrate lyase subunit beta [Crocinitomicaceae bacterium]|nr:citrate lyase subunit beta [Crocinitomicaceae bacterium]|tara:strand:+ start:73123 stop:74088 length:966 start_codon:yes stop_codon:yes gene_type:complete
MVSPYSLGATMYVPGTHADLYNVISGAKYPNLTSVVICTEDAINESEVPMAISNIATSLERLAKGHGRRGPKVFIRPRDLTVAKTLTSYTQLKSVCGFVIPKFNLSNIDAWAEIMALAPNLMWMPTLEDCDVFDIVKMSALADKLSQDHANRTLMVRIGGNDLLNCLGLRRMKGLTLYDTPLGYTLKQLASIYLSKGVKLASPVMEHIDDTETLSRELQLDLAHGFVSKTAIHPSQVETINTALQVDEHQLEEAEQILNSTSAVFKLNGSMAEPATHKNWAMAIKARAEAFGLTGGKATLSAGGDSETLLATPATVHSMAH